MEAWLTLVDGFDETWTRWATMVFEGLGGSQDLGTSSRTRPRKYFECAVWGGDVNGAAGRFEGGR